MEKLGTWHFQKHPVFDFTYRANWSHIHLDITWPSDLIEMIPNRKNNLCHSFWSIPLCNRWWVGFCIPWGNATNPSSSHLADGWYSPGGLKPMPSPLLSRCCFNWVASCAGAPSSWISVSTCAAPSLPVCHKVANYEESNGGICCGLIWFRMWRQIRFEVVWLQTRVGIDIVENSNRPNW